jgi:hypothetical protein
VEFNALCSIAQINFVRQSCVFAILFHESAKRKLLDLLGILLKDERVPVTVLVFQIARRPVYYKATIYHNRNVVAQLFCFIHSMSSQEYGRIRKFFHHPKESSSRDRIYSSSWLVQEFNLRAENEGLSTAELSLVSSRQVFRSDILELGELKSL